MNAQEKLHEQVLERLNRTVIEAAAYLATADEGLTDGRYTAFGVLAQLVFWHEQYVSVAGALLQGRPPTLKAGTFERLNQVARSNYSSDSMTMLAYDLSCLQKEFAAIARKLPDWSVNFPIKHDSEPLSLADRLVEIERQIRCYVQRLKRAQQLQQET